MPPTVGLAVFYILGALITVGVIGGVRDEMEGIGDLATIFFWPLALVIWVINKGCKACFALGRWLGAVAKLGR